MTSHYRVGRGVQNDPLKIIGHGRQGVKNHQKSSDVVYGRSLYLMCKQVCQNPAHFLPAQMSGQGSLFSVFIVLGMCNFDTYIDLIFLKPLLKVGQDGLGFDKSLCAGLYRASHRQATGGHRRGGHRRRAPRGHSYWNGRHTLQVSQVGVASRGLVHPSGKFQGRRRMVEVCKIDFQIMYPYFLIWGTMGQKIL